MKNEVIELTEDELQTIKGGGPLAEWTAEGAAAGGVFGACAGASFGALGALGGGSTWGVIVAAGALAMPWAVGGAIIGGVVFAAVYALRNVS
jgi:bacteriocin-like protein